MTIKADAADGAKALLRCPQCRKILFRKKDGRLACPNECGQSSQRRAFNTVVDPLKDRRAKQDFDPWSTVKY